MADKIENKHLKKGKNISEQFSTFCKREGKNFKLCKTINNEYFYSLCSKGYDESKDFCEANDMKLISTENSEFWEKENSGNFSCMQHLWKFWVDFESCDNEEFIKKVRDGKENCKLKLEKMQSLENSSSTALVAERNNGGGMYFKVLKINKKKKFVCVKETTQENTTEKIPESQTIISVVNTTKEEINQNVTAKTVSESTTKAEIDVLNPNVKETSKEITTKKETDQKVNTEIVSESTTKPEIDMLNPNVKEISKEFTTKKVLESTLKANFNVATPTTQTTDLVNTDTKTSGYTISPPTYIIPIFCVFVIIFIALAFRKFNKNNDSKKPKNDEEANCESIEMDGLLDENKS